MRKIPSSRPTFSVELEPLGMNKSPDGAAYRKATKAVQAAGESSVVVPIGEDGLFKAVRAGTDYVRTMPDTLVEVIHRGDDPVIHIPDHLQQAREVLGGQVPERVMVTDGTYMTELPLPEAEAVLSRIKPEEVAGQPTEKIIAAIDNSRRDLELAENVEVTLPQPGTSVTKKSSEDELSEAA